VAKGFSVKPHAPDSSPALPPVNKTCRAVELQRSAEGHQQPVSLPETRFQSIGLIFVNTGRQMEEI